MADRVNTFNRLPIRKDLADELADARTDYTGEVYTSAGNAIRGGDEKLNAEINKFSLQYDALLSTNVVSIEGAWSADRDYNAFSVVTDENGNSYTSKQFVPAGTPLSDTDYWALTSDYSEQMEKLRADFDQAILGIQEWDAKLAAEESARENADTTINSILSKTVAPNAPKILGHRGISTVSPWIYSIDNSLWSFMGAYASGFDGFECDVRKDVNGVLVMLHDADVSSVSNSSGDISTLDYTNVYYKTKKTNVDTTTVLTTLEETAQITKAFNGFIFVEVKDNTTAKEVSDSLLSYGLTYDNFGVFKIGDSAWIVDALSNTDPETKIGYNADGYTATFEDMDRLKELCDTYGKPYGSVIVRCVKPAHIQTIKTFGFLASLEGIIDQNNFDMELVDYSIAERRWNGENDALTNYKGIPYRVFGTESNNYDSLASYIDGIASKVSTGNMFFGRIYGSKLNEWLSALGVTGYINKASDGAHVIGIKDSEFATGDIHIFRSSMVITFSYEYSTGKLYMTNLSEGNNSYYITKDTLDAIASCVRSEVVNQVDFHGRIADGVARSLLGITNSSGMNATITANYHCVSMLCTPNNSEVHYLIMYTRNLNDGKTSVTRFDGTAVTV